MHLTLEGAPTNGVDEVQQITPGGTISGGTWQITYDGQQTAALAHNAAASAVQAALDALSNVEPGDIVVSGGPLTVGFFALTFKKNLGGLDVPQVTVASSLTGTGPTATPSTTTAGVHGTYRGAGAGVRLQDETNGILYANTGSSETPVWTESTLALEAERTRTDTPSTGYNGDQFTEYGRVTT